jgi:hypothetical protein
VRQIIDAAGKRAYRYTLFERLRAVCVYYGLMVASLALAVLLGTWMGPEEYSVMSGFVCVLFLGAFWAWADARVQNIWMFNAFEDEIAEYERDHGDWN